MKRSKPKPKKVGQTTIKLETLRPLPVRITQRQYLRLVAHREIDQLAIQEHVRRALDLYLDDLDWRRTIQVTKASSPAMQEMTGANPGKHPSQISRPHREPPPPDTAEDAENVAGNAGAIGEKPAGAAAKATPKLVYR